MLALGALLAVGLFLYAFIRSRTGFMDEAMDHQGMVIGVKKASRFGDGGDVDVDAAVLDPVLEQIELWRGSPPVFNDGAFLPWADLKKERPDVVKEVPDDLRELLDEAEELSAKVTSLRGIVKNMTVAELKDQGDRLRDEAGIRGKGGTKLRINVDGQWAKYVELSGIWITRTPFLEWCEQYVDKHHPDAGDWEVEVLVANERAGSTAEAERLADAVFDWLETKDIAVGLREETEDLAALGDRILHRVRAMRTKGKVESWLGKGSGDAAAEGTGEGGEGTAGGTDRGPAQGGDDGP